MGIKQRILEISHNKQLSHIGSCLTACQIIDYIFKKKKTFEPFILSSGHAGLAQYVVHEARLNQNAETLYEKHGTHPNRDKEDQIWASTGSLGHGLGIAVGYALSDRSRKVYVVVSDGELAEGSNTEALWVIKREKIENIEIHVNFNGWGANRHIQQSEVFDIVQPAKDACKVVLHRTEPGVYFLDGLDAHYKVMTSEEYQSI